MSIELDPTPFPALVVDDSLRDSTGRAVPLTARAFNSRNEPIPDARPTFLRVDTAQVVRLDTLTGHVVGLRTGQTSVVATVGRLQSERVTVRVTIRPDSVAPVSQARDSLRYVIGSDTVYRFRVRLVADSARPPLPDTTVSVANYLVRFAIVSPPGLSPTDTTRVLLVNDSRRPSTADTTDASGSADRGLRISRATQGVAALDSVIVEATALRPNRTPVRGSPLRFILKVRI